MTVTHQPLMTVSSIPAVLIFSILLIGVCWSFGYLLVSEDLLQRSRKDRLRFLLINLLLCAGFILAISGLSLMAYHLPIFLAFP